MIVVFVQLFMPSSICIGTSISSSTDYFIRKTIVKQKCSATEAFEVEGKGQKSKWKCLLPAHTLCPRTRRLFIDPVTAFKTFGLEMLVTHSKYNLRTTLEEWVTSLPPPPQPPTQNYFFPMIAVMWVPRFFLQLVEIVSLI